MRLKLTLTLIAMLTFGVRTEALESDSTLRLQSLELISKFDIPAAPMPSSTARDVRWASDSTIYIAFGSAGAAEFDVDEGLRMKREIFAPRNRDGAKTIKNLWNLAVSKDSILGFNATGEIAWRQASAESDVQLKSLRGFLEAMDISGDKVVLLGQPGWTEFEKSGWSFLWTATMGSGFTDWKAIGDLKLASSKDAAPLMNRVLGSLRLLPNGSFVVVPVVKPGVFLYESSGKLEASWTPSELEISLLEALGQEVRAEALAEEGKFSTSDVATDVEQVNADLGKRRLIVEDVVPLGKECAVIVRYRSGESSGFYLGLLASETAWYKLPLKGHPATVRVRSDSLVRKKQLALLVSDRGKPSAGTEGQIYILRLP